MRARAAPDFDAFVASHGRRLLHSAELLVGPADAEDLVQGVLMRMYLRWPKIRQQDPASYARRALANAATDRWRYRRRRGEVLVDRVPDRGRVEADPHPQREGVLRALATLTARERAVIVLRYYEDLSEAQIAADLGIAVGTVKSTAHRALGKLRECSFLMSSPSLEAPA